MSSYCDSSLGKTPISVTNRSASGMRDWSRSRGSIARSWTEKPCNVGQRAKSALIFEEFGERAGDILEYFAVLLGRQARRDTHVGNEKLVVLGAHREARELGAAREEGLHLLLELRAQFHGSTVAPRDCAMVSSPRARPAYSRS